MAELDPREKQFDVLYSALGELQTGLISSTTQVAGFFLLAIGWLATSDKARVLLQEHRTGRYTATAGLVGAYGLYAFGAYLVYARSQRTSNLLARVDLMPSEFYAGRVLNLAELFVFAGGTFFLFGIAVGLILCRW